MSRFNQKADDQNIMPKVMAGGNTNSIGLVINSSNPLGSLNGGTGVSNNFTITLGGAISTAASFTTVGPNALTLTTTGTTNITFPTTGTLVNTAVTTLSSLSSIGTITTGVWNGTIITGTYGGTGINNGANTITAAGNVNFASSFTTSGANSLTLTTTGATNVTLPTSGTLATVIANGIATTDVTTTTVTMVDAAPYNIYLVDNTSQVTLTLPTTAAKTHIFEVIGVGTGGWKIAQGTGQSVTLQNNGSNVSTSVGTGGSITSNLSSDCIKLATTATNTTFTAASSYAGSLSYI